MGKSRGRHAAPRSGFSRVVGLTAGAAGVLFVGGLLVSLAVPMASAGSSPDRTPTAAAIAELKGFAAGPPKPTPTAPVVVPRTVLDPDAVADPYPEYTPATPAAPAPPASTAATAAPSAG